LLITEQELEEIQKTMAISSNIKIASEDDILIKKKEKNRAIVRLKKINQYRVLFYFIRLFVNCINLGYRLECSSVF
jgi:hypothetical protein